MRLLLAILLATAANAAVITFDFESLADDTPVTNQLSGLTFTNTRSLSAGLTLNELLFPPRSGSVVLADIGGAIEIQFTDPVLIFSGFFTYSNTLTLSAFDVLNQAVGVTNSAFASNLASSPNPPNEQLQLSYSGGITRVAISGSSYTLDDLELTTADASEIPEPASWILLTLGLAVIVRRR